MMKYLPWIVIAGIAYFVFTKFLKPQAAVMDTKEANPAAGGGGGVFNPPVSPIITPINTILPQIVPPVNPYGPRLTPPPPPRVAPVTNQSLRIRP